MTPEQVIDEVKRSGLRGRGGAGFPTGLKWEFCCKSPGKVKYLICNADEGDPGAFQDRSVLEGDPHSVLEGMIIAGYAVSAERGMHKPLPRPRRGVVSMNFYFAESPANVLTNPALDPVSKIPEYKVCAARIERNESSH